MEEGFRNGINGIARIFGIAIFSPTNGTDESIIRTKYHIKIGMIFFKFNEFAFYYLVLYEVTYSLYRISSTPAAAGVHSTIQKQFRSNRSRIFGYLMVLYKKKENKNTP